MHLSFINVDPIFVLKAADNFTLINFWKNIWKLTSKFYLILLSVQTQNNQEGQTNVVLTYCILNQVFFVLDWSDFFSEIYFTVAKLILADIWKISYTKLNELLLG